ncbi:uncharacterized protein LOC105285470 isoform X2 [Ooceraea biroi]|uniref:uncharacterized protein LOC105285470 isoform X2 n=1 Tax=Ooceraea biroi TaxID=2015173 RepID=UPI0005B9C590|nr:uncharacterized protein LOC105285470 isoform X2 [Ooceraea biroi]
MHSSIKFGSICVFSSIHTTPFCNNSTAKGYIVKIFPKNPERRAQWVANMNVENWIPNNRSYLCEVHFSPEMWEQRRDKKPKLKLNAVPTIFGYWLKEKTFKRTEDKAPLTHSVQNETICDKGQSTTDHCLVESTIRDEGQSTTDQCSGESTIRDEGRSTRDKEQLSLFTKNTQNYVLCTVILIINSNIYLENSFSFNMELFIFYYLTKVPYYNYNLRKHRRKLHIIQLDHINYLELFYNNYFKKRFVILKYSFIHELCKENRLRTIVRMRQSSETVSLYCSLSRVLLCINGDSHRQTLIIGSLVRLRLHCHLVTVQ